MLFVIPTTKTSHLSSAFNSSKNCKTLKATTSSRSLFFFLMEEDQTSPKITMLGRNSMALDNDFFRKFSISLDDLAYTSSDVSFTTWNLDLSTIELSRRIFPVPEWPCIKTPLFRILNLLIAASRESFTSSICLFNLTGVFWTDFAFQIPVYRCTASI